MKSLEKRSVFDGSNRFSKWPEPCDGPAKKEMWRKSFITFQVWWTKTVFQVKTSSPAFQCMENTMATTLMVGKKCPATFEWTFLSNSFSLLFNICSLDSSETICASLQSSMATKFVFVAFTFPCGCCCCCCPLQLFRCHCLLAFCHFSF